VEVETGRLDPPSPVGTGRHLDPAHPPQLPPPPTDRPVEPKPPRWTVEGAFDADDVSGAIDVDRRLARGALAHRLRGDAADASRPWDVDLRLDVPPAAHAPIEPRACVAEWTADDELHAWVGSQDVFYVRDVIAARLGLDEARVNVQGMRVGGAIRRIRFSILFSKIKLLRATREWAISPQIATVRR
jgi:hypothetical protein